MSRTTTHHHFPKPSKAQPLNLKIYRLRSQFISNERLGFTVGKSGGKRFLLRYTSPVSGKKASIGLGKHPETDIVTLRRIAKDYRQQILEV